MKKSLFFCLAVLPLLLTRCDGSCTIELIVVNQTESEVVVSGGYFGTIEILPGDERLVDRSSSTCAPGGSLTYKDDAIVLYANMSVGGVDIPEEIWKSKYWELDLDDSNSKYTLIVTDELINEILSEQQM